MREVLGLLGVLKINEGENNKGLVCWIFSGRDTPKNSNYSLITYVIFYYVYVCKSITQFSYIIWTCVADAFFFGEQEHIFREDLLGNAHILGSMNPIAASQHVMAREKINRSRFRANIVFGIANVLPIVV